MPLSNPKATGMKDRRKPLMVKMPEQPTPRDDSPAGGAPVADLDDKCVMNLGGEWGETTVHATELERIEELGRGAYGVVEKMRHKESGIFIAVKRIHTTPNDIEQRRLITELQTSMRSSTCAHMVKFYGAMFREGDVWLCMEVMDTSLDKFYRMCVDLNKRIPEAVMAKVAYSVISALQYMKQEMNLIHRDVKPSNILLNRQGEIKLCDFGISGHLTNSVAKTVNAGCKPYMPPERIEGDNKDSYDVRADVWSLGITLVEVATGTHPYAKWKTPFEQLKQVVHEPPPRLPPNDPHWSNDFKDFVIQCLTKSFQQRPKYETLVALPWIVRTVADEDTDLGAFITAILDSICGNQAQLQKLGSIDQPAPPLSAMPPEGDISR